MENEERQSASFGASTKAVSCGTVLDNWEDAVQDDCRSQELERNIEAKLGKMKQKQISGNLAPSDVTLDSVGSTVRHTAATSSMSGDFNAGSASAPGPTIRILKRPQSTGNFNQGQQPNVQQRSSNHGQRYTARSSEDMDGNSIQRANLSSRTLEERAAAYAEARMRIFGVADQQIHDDLPVPPKVSMLPRTNEATAVYRQQEDRRENGKLA